MPRPAYVLVPALLALTLLATPAATYAQADTTVALSEHHFLQHMQYLTRDGGRWRTPNPAYQPGTGQPEAFGYAFAWNPTRKYVTVRILGHHGTDATTVYWEGVTVWNPAERQITLHQFGWDGAIGYGHTRLYPDSTEVNALTFTRPDGSQFNYEDRTTRTGPDAFTTRSYIQQPDGTWQERQVLHWERLPEDG